MCTSEEEVLLHPNAHELDFRRQRNIGRRKEAEALLVQNFQKYNNTWGPRKTARKPKRKAKLSVPLRSPRVRRAAAIRAENVTRHQVKEFEVVGLSPTAPRLTLEGLGSSEQYSPTTISMASSAASQHSDDSEEADREAAAECRLKLEWERVFASDKALRNSPEVAVVLGKFAEDNVTVQQVKAMNAEALTQVLAAYGQPYVTPIDSIISCILQSMVGGEVSLSAFLLKP